MTFSSTVSSATEDYNLSRKNIIFLGITQIDYTTSSRTSTSIGGNFIALNDSHFNSQNPGPNTYFIMLACYIYNYGSSTLTVQSSKSPYTVFTKFIYLS